MKRSRRAALVAAAVASSAAAAASETIEYSYDALGRLIHVSTTSGPDAGTLVTTGYDPAGNRCNYRLSDNGVAGTTACAAPAGGTSADAVNDSGGTVSGCTDASYAVLGNDSGTAPLSVTSASIADVKFGSASTDGTLVTLIPSGIGGTASITYSIRDGLGSTDSATLTFSVTTCTQ